MPRRTFNGHEIAFLMGMDEDHPKNFVVARRAKSTRNNYQCDEVVVKHPDGKLYQFDFLYNDEHGIYPCCEWPNGTLGSAEAIEVEPVEVVTITYRPKKD